MEASTEVLAALLGPGSAPEPGVMAPKDVIHPGDMDVPPMVLASLTSAGHTYIYDTRTGQRSLTNNNMLPTQLKKLRPDGSRVFTTIKPNVASVAGTVLCMLHETHPNRSEYMRYGWATCRGDHFMSEFHMERHMASKHKAEWAAIKDAKGKAERAEDRAFQRAILEGRRPPKASS